jgi:S1-C subfamily serine protease
MIHSRIIGFAIVVGMLSHSCFAATETACQTETPERLVTKSELDAIVARAMTVVAGVTSNVASLRAEVHAIKEVIEESDSDADTDACSGVSESKSASEDDVDLIMSPLKQRVLPFTEQVFKIEFSDGSSGHSGTGFMFDAREGVIATNHHVVTSGMGRFKIILENGEEFNHEDVKILGLSPAQSYGDFAFLQVEKLKGVFSQMPFAESHFVKKMDPIAFMGNSLGSFSVQDGFINGRYNFDLSKYVHANQVHLHSNGGASGSPTFNRSGDINGILFGGDTEHTLILPIYHLVHAYDQIRTGLPISKMTLGAPLMTSSIYEIEKFHRIDRSILLPYLSDIEKDEKKLLVLVKDGVTPLEAGDVILTINGERVGCDTILLEEYIKSRPASQVTVLRHGTMTTFEVTPSTKTLSYSKRLIIDDAFVLCNDSSLSGKIHGSVEAPIFGLSVSDEDGKNDGLVGIVQKINGVNIADFNEIIRVLHEQYYEEKILYYLITVFPLDDRKRGKVLPVDLSTMEGKDLYVQFFDEIKKAWQQIRLDRYMKELALV